MILGIGIDICDINRLSKTLERYEKRFEERCFTELERKKCQRSFSKKNCYAKRFAAKEATSKALGTGINKGVSWKQIEVENLKSGKPIINLYGNAKKRLESMLPKKFPELSDLDIAAGLITSTEVGGDYYDYFLEDNGDIYIVCGDATGHGTAAGMMVSIIKSALNGLPILPVNKILEQLNKIVKKIDLGRLKMSLTVSKIKGNKLYLSSAAMPPTYLYNLKNKNCEEIMIQGLPLGGLNNETFKLYENKFSKGDILVMISDGLPEAENENSEMYNYDRIKDTILKNSNESANNIKDSLLDELNIWLKGGIPDDDATVVVVKKI